MFADKYQTFPTNTLAEPDRVTSEVLADLINRGLALKATYDATYRADPTRADSDLMDGLAAAVGAYVDDVEEAKCRVLEAGVLNPGSFDSVLAP